MWGWALWKTEEDKCAGARVIEVPALGETEPVLIRDVVERRVWFSYTGTPCCYLLRDGETVMYVGTTTNPIGYRLRGAISARKTWTQADWTNWTVTLQRTPELGSQGTGREDLHYETALIRQYSPTWNIMGRPRKTVPAGGKMQ